MRYYDFSSQGQSQRQRPLSRRREKKHISIKIPLLILLISTLIPYLYSQFGTKTETDQRAETLSAKTEVTTEDTLETKNSRELGLIVQEALKDTKGKYSVVIKNTTTGEQYMFQEHERYLSGSLYKLWVMAEACNQLQNGKLKEDQILSQDITAINAYYDIASESAEMTEGSISLPVNQAMKQMITISHNYAALLLAQKVGLKNISEFITNNHYTESKIGSPPMTSAYDIYSFFDTLYHGKMVNAQYNDVMLGLLKEQQLNNKLPKYLPENVVVAHKTGELGFVSHDAGIVYTPKGDYIIVVLTETSYPEQAEERIADISKGVYAYFNK